MCFFKDSTEIIELLENTKGRAFSFLRPFGFGKSLLLSIIDHFYNITYKEQFYLLFEVCCAEDAIV
jgi:hypothetical protein